MKPVRTYLVGAGGGLFLKPECAQPGGSYKARGVARLLAHGHLPPQGLSTVSAGNLGRALALGCREAGVPCTVYVPDGAPAAKKEKIASLGATLVELSFAQIWNLLVDPPSQSGFVHPIRCAELLEGYGDIAREIAEDLPHAQAVVLPFGLGGLFLGVARALRDICPRVQIYAAELADQAPLAAALAGREILRPKAHGASFVDAIGTPSLLPEVLPQVKPLLAGSVTVQLDDARDSLRRLHAEQGLVVEGAAAVAHAAAVRLGARLSRQKIVALLSGGNIAPEVHARELAAAVTGLRAGSRPASRPGA